jgi:hypothetical protein
MSAPLRRAGTRSIISWVRKAGIDFLCWGHAASASVIAGSDRRRRDSLSRRRRACRRNGGWSGRERGGTPSIQRGGLPRSGYIVSLVLWAIKNKSKGEILNEAVLLQNIIDHLLGRMDYTGALRGEFDFESKSAVLQSLAMFLKEEDDVVATNQATEYVIKFLKDKGLSYDASEAVRGFVTCGILHQLQDKISFRYKRFQEFFVSRYLRDNPDALQYALRGDNWMKFVRELDICSSRFRHEQWLLDEGLKKVSENPLPRPKLVGKELTTYLSAGPPPDYTQRHLKRMRTKKLTAKKIDEIFDRTERGMARRSTNPVESPETAMERDFAVARSHAAIELHSP